MKLNLVFLLLSRREALSKELRRCKNRAWLLHTADWERWIHTHPSQRGAAHTLTLCYSRTLPSCATADLYPAVLRQTFTQLRPREARATVKEAATMDHPS